MTGFLSAVLTSTALSLLLGGPALAQPRAAPAPSVAAPFAAAPLLLVQDEAAPEAEQPRRRKPAADEGAKPAPGRDRKAQGDDAGAPRKRAQAADEGDADAPARPRKPAADADAAPAKPKRAQAADDADAAPAPRKRTADQNAEEPAPRPRKPASADADAAQPKPNRAQAAQDPDAPATPRKRADAPAAEGDAPARPRDAGRPKTADQAPDRADDAQPARPRRATDADAKPDPQQAEDADKRRRDAERQRAQDQAAQDKAAQDKAAQDKAAQDRAKRDQANRDQPDQNAAGRDRRPDAEDQAGDARPREGGRNDAEAGDTNGRPRRADDARPDDATRDRPRNNAEGGDTPRRPRDNADADDQLPPGEAASHEGAQRPRDGDTRPRRDADNRPPPADDRAAQGDVRPQRVESVDAEQGTGRRDARNDDDDAPDRRARPDGTDVVREIGNRLILRYNDQTLVESSDRPRLRRDARDVYEEDLPNQRTRETVVRGDGVRVVTIRNRYGDVIRRSRITPDGREYVLNYVEEEDTPRVRDWRDPGLDLPPFRPNVAERDYILDAERAPTSDDYYQFLEKPPVERVERLYSLDEVKRSARVRQKTRRVDLDTITFDFGSAAVPEDEVNKLDGVASAMQRLLKENPAETFLIEGHTDAVGSEDANLVLSDRRAESVADALTNVFDIPPENLATQGYGEQYLKVSTDGPERENRRVAIRRITPLVAPVASNDQQ